MKIIDVLKDSAELLGLKDEVNVLTETTLESESQVLQENPKVASLFNLIKLSIRELCSNYAPNLCTVEMQTEDLKIPLNELENCIRVQYVNSGDNMVKFKTINRNIVLEKDGSYMITYLMYPTINSLYDEVNFLQNLSPEVLVFGLCSYYSIANGMFDEFEKFHDNYLSKAEALKELKFFDMPARRWE